jgi:hypothetical protein
MIPNNWIGKSKQISNYDVVEKRSQIAVAVVLSQSQFKIFNLRTYLPPVMHSSQSGYDSKGMLLAIRVNCAIRTKDARCVWDRQYRGDDHGGTARRLTHPT